MTEFEIETDIPGIKLQIRQAIDRALPVLAQQILKDCNYFCKQDQGGLINSSLIASNVESGDLIWDTVYANRQYWLPTACTDVNSNAAYMWCHKAYDRFHDDWEKLLQKLLEEDSNA